MTRTSGVYAEPVAIWALEEAVSQKTMGVFIDLEMLANCHLCAYSYTAVSMSSFLSI